MELHHQPIFVFLVLTLGTSQAALPSELYWNTVLPNTPIPRAIKNTLRTGLGKGGVNIDAYGWQDINIYQCRSNNNAENQDHLLNNPNAALYLLEKDMVPGTQMDLNFTKSPNTATFLPRQIADSIPFSLNKLPEILNQFSVQPESFQAEIIKTTLKDCEDSRIKDEEFCATSLESMIDYSISKLGKQVRAISTEVQKETLKQKYTFMPEVKMISTDKTIVCHKEKYAYAVFFCHEIPATSAYTVPLLGADGSKAKTVAVCHKDTSDLNPNSVGFKVLKVKPGTTICHFLLGDVVVWAGN